MTKRDTPRMGRALSFRLNEESERALRVIEATGMTTSEAIRTALIATAESFRHRRAVAEEAVVLEQDEADRAEMKSVAALMESLRAPR